MMEMKHSFAELAANGTGEAGERVYSVTALIKATLNRKKTVD